MNSNAHDVIIVGAGPAGMTAGIYAARKQMKTLILSSDVGGQMAKTAIIENHPGEVVTDGVALSFKIKEQAESFGVKFETQKVKKLEQKKEKNNLFEITTENEKKFLTKSVILAFGMRKRKLNLPNEDSLIGKGISYCITCDGPMFKNKKVAVIGGGNAGAEAVEFLAKICPQIYWLEILPELLADKILQNKISKFDNVEIFTQSSVKEIVGEKILEKIILNQAGQTKELEIQGLFVEVGYESQAEWLGNLVKLDARQQIIINDLCHTSQSGIFAAGDCVDSKYKQIVIAEGQGAIAALEAYEFINS